MGDRQPFVLAWLHGGRNQARGSRRTAPAAELVVVNFIAEHHVEADEELAGEGDLGLGPTESMQDREVPPPQVLIGAGGERGGLAQDPTEERVALLGDLADPMFVSRRIDGGGQADVADDGLAIGEACDRSQDEHRRESSQQSDAGVGQQALGPRIAAAEAIWSSSASIRVVSQWSNSRLSSRRRRV